VLPQVNILLVDKYGNYTCQKLYQFISSEIKLKFLNSIDFFMISTHDTGTYPLQSIVENSKKEDEKELILKKYLPHFKELAMNKNGNHIIEKSLANLTFEKSLIFFDIIEENFMTFACDQYGIKIIKLFCNSVHKKSKYFEIFEEKLFSNLFSLINHEFGNYLIQSAIESWKIFFSWKIVEIFDKRLLSLSVNKYSSNVFEKLITKLEDVRKSYMIIFFYLY
jgi:hypothetical protein